MTMRIRLDGQQVRPGPAGELDDQLDDEPREIEDTDPADESPNREALPAQPEDEEAQDPVPDPDTDGEDAWQQSVSDRLEKIERLLRRRSPARSTGPPARRPPQRHGRSDSARRDPDPPRPGDRRRRRRRIRLTFGSG